MIIYILLVFHVLGIFSCVHAIMSTRTSQGSIAWAVSLITFPYIAVPAYWVLGRSKFQGYVTEKRYKTGQISHITLKVQDSIKAFVAENLNSSGSLNALEKLARIPLLSGNDVELLIDGDATFRSIFGGIEAAEDYILFQFFIVHDDRIGRELKERLVSKAKAGVAIFFLYDEVGSHDLPESYIKELKNVGVKIFPFHTQKGFRNRFQLNFRNHRKNVVIDGKYAWIGGHNVGDEYLGRDPKFGHWRDTHVKIAGPAVMAAQHAFLEDYHWAADTILDVNWRTSFSGRGDKNVIVIPSGPADTVDTASLMFVHAINSAKSRIWIASPYFVPDEAVITALELACMRDVEVKIIIPDKPDHLLVYLAAFSYFDRLSEIGVRFYRYQDGFPHQKVMLIDDFASSVGTANFDNRSFRLNFEITAFVVDRSFNLKIEEMLQKDMNAAREMKKDEVAAKPFWFKLAIRCARLTAPVQ